VYIDARRLAFGGQGGCGHEQPLRRASPIRRQASANATTAARAHAMGVAPQISRGVHHVIIDDKTPETDRETRGNVGPSAVLCGLWFIRAGATVEQVSPRADPEVINSRKELVLDWEPKVAELERKSLPKAWESAADMRSPETLRFRGYFVRALKPFSHAGLNLWRNA